MFGCESLAAASTSRWNRLTASGDLVDRRRQHLEGHHPLHPPVLGLVDLAHAALAELVQDHVVAHHQPAGLALVDRPGPGTW